MASGFSSAHLRLGVAVGGGLILFLALVGGAIAWFSTNGDSPEQTLPPQVRWLIIVDSELGAGGLFLATSELISCVNSEFESDCTLVFGQFHVYIFCYNFS